LRHGTKEGFPEVGVSAVAKGFKNYHKKRGARWGQSGSHKGEERAEKRKKLETIGKGRDAILRRKGSGHKQRVLVLTSGTGAEKKTRGDKKKGRIM